MKRRYEILSAAPSAIVGSELSPREKQVLELICQGMSYAEIGDVLNIAESTVKHHSQNLRSRLGARNAAHAVYLWTKEHDEEQTLRREA